MENEYLAVGLMSGTSVDGIDAALFRIRPGGEGFSPEGTEIRLLAGRTSPFPPELRREILDLSAGGGNALARLTLLNMRLGELYAEAVKELLEESGTEPEQVRVIGSHGQTLYHIPEEQMYGGAPCRGTLQIGEGSVIAQRTGIPTVSDFRPADMAAGGGGAPFVPLLDRILAPAFPGPTAFQNIGGIGNVGYFRRGALTAFDTGPGNMIIDRLAEEASGGALCYDKDGALGRKGKVLPELLEAWLAHPYLRVPPPKSTGRELFGEEFLRARPLPPGTAPEDGIRTAEAYTARSIIESYRLWLPEPPATLIVSGGGAHNPLIMEDLKAGLPGTRVLSGDEAGISSDFKEAAAFALMALFYLLDIPSTEKDATGASAAVIAGKLSKPLPGGPSR